MKIIVRGTSNHESFKSALLYISQRDISEAQVQSLLSYNPKKDDLFMHDTALERDHILHYILMERKGLSDEFIISTMQYMIKNDLIDVNTVCTNGSPLVFFAAQSSTPAVLRFLLDNGAKVYDDNGVLLRSSRSTNTVMHYTRHNNIACILENCAKSTITFTDPEILTQAQKFGYTELVDRYISKHPDMVETCTKVILKSTGQCIKSSLCK